ncbi:MAG: HEAT repeat domain-containing protein [Gemmatimonadota bacterium]|nr:MAG: HEAT repeat domain-containing protein [Gemmatimonadota bacterium]
MNSPYILLTVELATDVLLKGTIVLGAAGLVTLLLSGQSAATRNAVWSAALAALLIIPVLSLALPSWRVEALHLTTEVAPAPVSHTAGSEISGENGCCDACCQEEPVESGGYITVPRDADTDGLATKRAVASEQGEWTGAERKLAGMAAAGIVILIWVAGLVALLARLALDACRAHGLIGRAAECREADVREIAKRLADRVRVDRRIKLLVSGEVSMPLSCGLWRPVVIFPETVTSWTAERKHVVLLHEIAHIARWDYAVHLMVEIVCAFYWFNPLVWLAARRNEVERERACDDEALRIGIRSDVYATHLVEIARAHVGRQLPRAAFAMAQPSSLARRVRSILARGLNRTPVTPRRMVSTGLAALTLVMPLASLEVWGVDFLDAVQGNDAVARRIRELRDDDPLVRRYAAWALGELEDHRGVAPLIDALEDDNADVRLVAGWGLGEIKDLMAIYPLIERLEDGDPLVREMATLALGEIEHPSAVEPLIEALGRHPELREPVIWALGEIQGSEADAARAAVFAEWGRPSWGNDEVWHGRLGSSEARAVAGDLGALVAALSDDEPRMRRSAAEWLGIRGDERAVDPLLDALRDRDPSVRSMAIWALDEINPSRRYSQSH